MLERNGASLAKNIHDCDQIKEGLQAERPITNRFSFGYHVIDRGTSVLPSVQTLKEEDGRLWKRMGSLRNAALFIPKNSVISWRKLCQPTA